MAEAPQLITFKHIAELCAAEGLHALAVIAPPHTLPADGLERMLDDGVGDMAYMRRHRDLRLRPRDMLPGARSLLVVSLPYQPEKEDTALKRARYAAGKDYHRLLRRKLSVVGRQLGDVDGNPFEYRATVDSAPVLERTLAETAGLGWLGKNGLLIDPGGGSYRFIGCLFTAAPLEQHRGPHGSDRCGSCRRCVAACPTDAIADRRVLSERCISYLTIEHFGVIPRQYARHFDGWWFGCDICQEVCPWNRFAPEAGDGRLTGRDDEEKLLSITAKSFDNIFAGRAVRRIGYHRFRRNLLVALWSLGQHERIPPILAEGLPLVKEQAQELGIV